MQFLFVAAVEVRCHKSWIVRVGDFVIHQAMKVAEDLSAEFIQVGGAVNAIGVRVFTARAYSKPGVSREIEGIRRHVERGEREIPVQMGGKRFMALLDISDRQRKFLLAGGALNFVRNELKGG